MGATGGSAQSRAKLLVESDETVKATGELVQESDRGGLATNRGVQATGVRPLAIHGGEQAKGGRFEETNAGEEAGADKPVASREEVKTRMLGRRKAISVCWQSTVDSEQEVSDRWKPTGG